MKKITEAWFIAAREDLVMAQKAFELGIYRHTCFHAQQAVEKSFKALLIDRGKQPKRVHDLLELYGIIENISLDLSISKKELDFLNRVYRFRYLPDIGLLPHGQPERQDGQKAVEIAEKVYKQIQKILEKVDPK